MPHSVRIPAAAREAQVMWAANPALGALVAASRVAPAVVRVPRLGWLVTDPVLIREVLTNHRATSVLGEGGVGHLWSQLLGDWVLDLFDGAGHHDLRTRSRDLFTDARAKDLLADAAEPFLGSLTSRLGSGESLDVADAARVLVGLLVGRMLGLDLERFRDAADRAGLDADGFGPQRLVFRRGEQLASLAIGTQGSTVLAPGVIARGREILEELTADVPDQFRTAAESSLLGRCRVLGLSEQEATGLVSLLLVAGTETAASAIARTVALVADTGSVARLCTAEGDERAALVEQAIREGLRVTTPAPLIGRHVTKDILLRGKRIRAGERVLCLTYAANTRAGGFDLDRPYLPENRQLWFGAGRHLCLGAAVAREELRRVIGAVADAGPWRVTSRAPARRVLIPTYRHLVIRALPR